MTQKKKEKKKIIVLHCNTMKMWFQVHTPSFLHGALVWCGLFHSGGPTLATSLKEMRNMQNL
jgi:hypothetical protein